MLYKMHFLFTTKHTDVDYEEIMTVLKDNLKAVLKVNCKKIVTFYSSEGREFIVTFQAKSQTDIHRFYHLENIIKCFIIGSLTMIGFFYSKYKLRKKKEKILDVQKKESKKCPLHLVPIGEQ